MYSITPTQTDFNGLHVPQQCSTQAEAATESTDNDGKLREILKKMASLDTSKLSCFDETVGEFVSEVDKVLKQVAVKAESIQTLTATHPSQNFVAHEPQRRISSIVFAGKSFIENRSIQTKQLDFLTGKGFLVEKPVLVDCYFRSEVRKRFNFKENGFEFVSLDQKLTEDLGSFADLPHLEDHRPLQKIIHEQSRLFLTEWGRKQGIEFDIVIPSEDLMYRHTTEDIEHQCGGCSIFKPVRMAHIDFCRENFSSFLTAYVGYQLEGILKEDFIKLKDFKVSEVVNLWTPLNKRPTRNTLSVMDTSTVRNRLEELKRFNLDGSSISTIDSKPHHTWVIQEDMQRGDGVVFKSCETPHASVDIEKAIECDDFRHSLEGRYLFCIDKRKEKEI